MRTLRELLRFRDTRWLIIGAAVLAAVGLWDVAFLNRPALARVAQGFVNTYCIALLVLVFTLLLAWVTTLALHFSQRGAGRPLHLALTFLLNLVRSIPQVVGILFGYVGVGMLIQQGALAADIRAFPLMALCMSLFIFVEVVDLMRERIEHYTKLDFVSAMRVCGVSEGRIVNFHIFWKNSRVHILNKLIAVFGIAVFLQCSVDFVISVGLSSDVSSVTMPTTLGSLLAKIDSKQDILAVGYTLTHPLYAGSLLLQHLQGVTVAFLIVFSLLTIYHVSNGFAERHRL